LGEGEEGRGGRDIDEEQLAQLEPLPDQGESS
jgi:hypothetical protein